MREQIVNRHRQVMVRIQQAGRPRHDAVPVRVRVIGDNEVSVDVFSQRERQVNSARFLRVREGNRWEPRIRLGLFGNNLSRRKPACLGHPLDK